MSAALIVGLLSGAIRLLIAGCIILRQILLEPDRPNYPNAAKRLRVGLFLLAAVLLFNGVDVICRALSDEMRPDHHHHVLISGLPLSLAWLGVEGLQLERVLRQWLPERTQQRIMRLMHLASCKNRDLAARERARNLGPVGKVRPLIPGAVISTPSGGVTAPALAELALAGVKVVGPLEGPEAVQDFHIPD